jgi:hypothetical protein
MVQDASSLGGQKRLPKMARRFATAEPRGRDNIINYWEATKTRGKRLLNRLPGLIIGCIALGRVKFFYCLAPLH